MSNLANLQAGFQAYLRDDARSTAFKSIVDDKKVGATKRLKIYHDAYRFRIIDALAAAYPKLQVYLGGGLFEDTARSYLTKTPSVYPNLRWYGEKMPAHLQQALPKHPIAAEMAYFEWALSLAFDAEDAPVLQLQDLAAVPPEYWGELRFKFQASVQLLALKHNTVAVWQALDMEETPPKPEKMTDTHWLIWRQDLTSKFRSLTASEVLALQMALASASFGEICEKLFESLGDDATMQAAQYLAGWLQAGLITSKF